MRAEGEPWCSSAFPSPPTYDDDLWIHFDDIAKLNDAFGVVKRLRLTEFQGRAGGQTFETDDKSPSQRHEKQQCPSRCTYHRAGSDFDERHNIADLFKACDPDKLGDAAKNRLRGPIQTIHLLWQNRHRFFSQDRLRCHLKALGPHRRDAKKGGDFLKEKCVDLENACLTVVTIGVQRWQ
jgi:hypothetical protein